MRTTRPSNKQSGSMRDAWMFILAMLSVIMLIDVLVAVLVIKMCRLLGCCDDPDTVGRILPGATKDAAKGVDRKAEFIP
jgi:hypothetical protein